MPDTHINGYFGAVDAALLEVRTAQAKLEAAQIALEAKKKEVGYVEPEEVKPKAPVQTQETESVDIKTSIFKKK